MKGTIGDNISVIIQWFLYGGVAFVGLALHAASSHESAIILTFSWVWVGIIYVMTMYRFHEDSMRDQHEKSHFIVTLEYDLDDPIHNELHDILPSGLNEFDQKYAIESFCKGAVSEMVRRETK